MQFREKYVDKTGVIYKITNLLNGKMYVGKRVKSTEKFNKSSYYGSGICITNAIKKYGKDNFKREIICECQNSNELNNRERFWIKELNTFTPRGYNIHSGGFGGSNGGSNRGRKWSLEHRKKISETLKEGLKSGRIIASFTGRHISDETKEKISKALIGFKPSPEAIEKTRQYNLGRPRSEETKRKIGLGNSISLRGKKIPNAVRQKISRSMKAYKLKIKLEDLNGNSGK